MVNALSYYQKVEEQGFKPDFVAGHSLGEFNALLAAECYSFESGLKLVKKRGELMSQVSDGAMAAIVNSSEEKILTLLKENGLNNIDLANFNTPSQIVLSGAKDEIVKAESLFTDGSRYYPLNTSGAFHSRYMAPSKAKFLTYLKKFKLSAPKIPVISNVTARPYEQEQLIDNLSNQIDSSVRWSESIQYLMKQGDADFIEVGFGEVLSGLIYKIKHETAKAEKALQQAEKKPAAGADKSVKAVFSADMSAEEKVKTWNSHYPVGTKVNSSLPGYDVVETKSQARVLFGHRAVVYMKNYNGYFSLDEITPV